MTKKNDLVKRTVMDYVLKNNPGYSLMLKGEWGVGKTYYWENELHPFINRILPCIHKEYIIEAHYVSLFGVEDIEQAKEAIALSILTSESFNAEQLNYKKIASTAMSLTVKKIAEKIGIEPQKSSSAASKIISLQSSVICLDDIERSIMPVDKLLSFVNHLLHNEGIKVILLANETNILKDFESYASKKEKAIGRTIDFSIDSKEIINAIISRNKRSHEETPSPRYDLLLNDLERNKNMILEFMGKIKSYNFRILNHSIEDLKSIYIHDKHNVLKGLSEEYRDQIIQFCFQLSFAIRSGELRSDDLKGINSSYDYRRLLSETNIDSTQNDSEENRKNDRISNFIKLYLQHSVPITPYFHMIKILLCDGLLDKISIQSDLEALFEIQQEENGPIEKFRFLNIAGDDDLVKTTDDLIQLIKEKEVPINYYIDFIRKIFTFIETNRIDKDEEEVFNIFERSLKDNQNGFENINYSSIKNVKNTLPRDENKYIFHLINSMLQEAEIEKQTLSEKIRETSWMNACKDINSFAEFLINDGEPLTETSNPIEDWLPLLKSLNDDGFKFLTDFTSARIKGTKRDSPEIGYWKSVVGKLDNLLQDTHLSYLTVFCVDSYKKVILSNLPND